MTVVGLITARAGSKRLPKKNLAPLGGKPLVAHTCDAAVNAGVLDAVYMNTDCPEIASLAGDHGVACPVLRPKHLAEDHTPPRDSNLFLLNFLARRGETYDAVLVLQPTSPLRSAEDIRQGVTIFERNAPCSVVSVSPLVPRSWMGQVGPDGEFDRWVGEETVYRLNGALYLHRWEDYVEGRTPRKTIAYVMPVERSVDIDHHVDLEYARFLMERVESPALAGTE